MSTSDAEVRALRRDLELMTDACNAAELRIVQLRGEVARSLGYRETVAELRAENERLQGLVDQYEITFDRVRELPAAWRTEASGLPDSDALACAQDLVAALGDKP